MIVERVVEDAAGNLAVEVGMALFPVSHPLVYVASPLSFPHMRFVCMLTLCPLNPLPA